MALVTRMAMDFVEQHFTKYRMWGARILLSPWCLLVQLLFSKHLQPMGSLVGPGSTWGTFSVMINCRLVFLSHLSLSSLSSDHCCFSLALGNYFMSSFIVALDLNPCSIGKRKQRGCPWTFPWLQKRIRSQWEFPRLTNHLVHRRNRWILLLPPHSLFYPPPS